MACALGARAPVRSALMSSLRRLPVQQSSESVGALAAALAKAQAQLVNPEKSLTATITVAGRAGETQRSFRYAPLSSGLEIVRKTLSEHGDRGDPDHRARPGLADSQFDDYAGPRIGPVDCLAMAGLPPRGYRKPAPHGRCSHLRPPLCPLYASGHCRRG